MKVKWKFKWKIVSASGKTLMKFYLKEYAVKAAGCYRTKVKVVKI